MNAITVILLLIFIATLAAPDASLISRPRRAVYWLTSGVVLLVSGAVLPALLIFHAARTLDVAARRWLLGSNDPYPTLRELIEWDRSDAHFPTQENQ